MFKVYTETITDDIVMFKNGKIEDNLEEVESILDAIFKAAGKPVWRWTSSFGTKESYGKIVIELSMSDEDEDKIMDLIKLNKEEIKKEQN